MAWNPYSDGRPVNRAQELVETLLARSQPVWLGRALADDEVPPQVYVPRVVTWRDGIDFDEPYADREPDWADGLTNAEVKLVLRIASHERPGYAATLRATHAPLPTAGEANAQLQDSGDEPLSGGTMPVASEPEEG